MSHPIRSNSIVTRTLEKMSSPHPDQPLPSTRRLVTQHNDDGKAIIGRHGLVHGKQTPHGPWIQLLWSSESLPPTLSSDDDFGLVDTGMSNNGTIVRIVDFPPGSKGLVHRSITLDYIFVLKGSVQLVLDDGSRTKVSEGEAVIQQATMHSWDNETDEWARLFCVLVASEKPVAGGRILEKHVLFNI